MKKRIQIILISVLVSTAAMAELSKELLEQIGPTGRQAYEKHTHLMEEVVPKYPHKIEIQANARYKKLTRVEFLTEPVEIDGDIVIPVPLDIARHVRSFRSIVVEADGLLGTTLIEFMSDEAGPREAKIGQKNDKSCLLDAGGPTYKVGTQWGIRFKGKATINKLIFANWEGINVNFNPAPYIAPGLDKPILDVAVNVDATKYRSIGGINNFKRERYFRYYAAPNLDRSGKEPYFKGMGFLPGRQIQKLWEDLEYRCGASDRLPHLTEDPDRPGYADSKYFEENPENFWRFQGVDPELEFAMCFDYWPSFMWPKDVNIANNNGTPEDHDAATDVAVQYLKALHKASDGIIGTWWEVKNECDIQSEWMWHHQEGYDGWGLLADFHNKMAAGIRKEFPETRVGGPASAWFQPQQRDFGVWKDHKRFMELTKGKMDFYSHHFYEMSSNDTHKEQLAGRNSYAQGMMECSLDMVKAQMVAMDYEVPILVTEYGTLDPPEGDLGYWINVKNINNMMMDMLDRPQELDLTVPFLLSFMHWSPDAKESFINQHADGEFYKNKNTYLIDQWTDFAGKRIPSSDDHRKIFTHSVIDGDLLRIVANNRSDQRAIINLSVALPEGIKAVSASRKMPVYAKGEMKFINEPVKNLTAVPIGVEETQIIMVKLSEAPALAAGINESVWYAPDTAVKLDKPIKTTIDISKDELKKKVVKATLRVGIQSAQGFYREMTLLVNGQEIGVVDLSSFKGAKNYFDYFEVDFDPSLLQVSNDIKVSVSEKTGYMSAAKIILTTE